MLVQSNWKRRTRARWFQRQRNAAIAVQRAWRKFVPYTLRLKATYQNEYRNKFAIDCDPTATVFHARLCTSDSHDFMTSNKMLDLAFQSDFKT